MFSKREDSNIMLNQGNDLVSLVDSENELSKVLDKDTLSDIQHSDRLKDFYKKLVQTDAAIRNLRKIMGENTNYGFKSDTDISNNFETDSDFHHGTSINLERKIDQTLLDRSKRSIKKLYPGRFFHFKRREPVDESKINKGKLFTKSTINMTGKKKPIDGTIARNKRFTDGSFVIEKNKVVIQYKPNRKVAKCSHAPKESKSHESQLTHPFYKNTQRLDELLDKFVDKKLPDFLSDRMEFEFLFDKNKKNKHPAQDEIILVQEDDVIKDYDLDQNDKKDQRVKENQMCITNGLQSESEIANLQSNKVERQTIPDYSTAKETQSDIRSVKNARNTYLNEFFQDSDGVEKTTDKATEQSTTVSYNIVLSVSTLLNSALTGPKLVIIDPSTDYPVRPNMRKLQQANNNKEEMTHDDVNDGASDYKEDQEYEMDSNDKNKRKSIEEDVQAKMQTMAHSPTGVHNPNWKGPMPLYPDELTQMIMKQTTQVNRVEVPVRNPDVAPESDDDRFKQSDVDYVEDYVDDGNEKLVEFAQAYSDYGVLDGKKQVNDGAGRKLYQRKNERDPNINSLENFMKKFHNFMQEPTFTPSVKNIKRDSFEKFVMEPYSNNNNDENFSIDFKGMLHKHLKFVNDPKKTTSKEFKHESEIKMASTKGNEYKDTETNKFKAHMDLMPLLYKKRTLKFLNENGYVATNKMENNVMDSKSQKQFPNQKELDKEEKSYEGVTEKDQYSNTKEINEEKPFDSLIDSHSHFTTISEGFNVDKIKENIESMGDSEANSQSNDFKKVNPITTVFFNTATQDQTEFQKDTFATEIYSINDRTENKRNDLYREAVRGDIEKSLVVINDGKVGADSKYDQKNKDSSLSHFLDRLAHWLSDKDKEHRSISQLHSYDMPLQSTLIDRSEQTPDAPVDARAVDTGFKSRMLLSVDINNNTEKIMSSGDDELIDNIQSTTEPMNANMTRTEHDTTVSTKNDQNANGTKNHKFKRQAMDDSNLIFWNDLYDEEYGINVDPLESKIRDKHSIHKNFLKRSNTWIQDKVKMIANKFNLGDLTFNPNSSGKPRHVKRSVTDEEDEEGDGGKFNLNKLTAKMKAICKETARAVQDTRHIKVREETQQDHASSSLMQQLVRLMTDLVDYQVHERTCRKLPADLQQFLDWLTSSKEESTIYPDIDDAEKNQEQLEVEMANNMEEPWLTLSTSSNMEYPTTEELEAQLGDRSQRTDYRTDCLGTLHAVQNLIREYEEMSEDDKSVMTGVKSYLENQMQFLRKQLSSFEDRENNGMRYKRDISAHTVANAFESTLDKGIKIIKNMYHKGSCKVKNAYKAAKSKLDKNKIKSKPKAKPEEKHKQKETVKIVPKDKKHKDIKHKGKMTGIHHKNKNKAHKEKGTAKEKSGYNSYEDDDFGFSLSKDKITDYETYMDQPSGVKQGRDVKDVYLDSEEVTKAASKGSQPLKNDDVFDKTEILRINDYSEKEQ